jgi:hypothetical protein
MRRQAGVTQSLCLIEHVFPMIVHVCPRSPSLRPSFCYMTLSGLLVVLLLPSACYRSRSCTVAAGKAAAAASPAGWARRCLGQKDARCSRCAGQQRAHQRLTGPRGGGKGSHSHWLQSGNLRSSNSRHCTAPCSCCPPPCVQPCSKTAGWVAQSNAVGRCVEPVHWRGLARHSLPGSKMLLVLAPCTSSILPPAWPATSPQGACHAIPCHSICHGRLGCRGLEWPWLCTPRTTCTWAWCPVGRMPRRSLLSGACKRRAPYSDSFPSSGAWGPWL